MQPALGPVYWPEVEDPPSAPLLPAGASSGSCPTISSLLLSSSAHYIVGGMRSHCMHAGELPGNQPIAASD